MEETRQCSQSNEDNFKVAFKFYKNKKQPSGLSDVVDLCNPNLLGQPENNLCKCHAGRDPPSSLLPACQWNAYTYDNVEGLIFIRNPFTKLGQQFWARRCLQDFPQAPNVTNLDGDVAFVSNHSIWKQGHYRNSINCSYKSPSSKLIDKLRWTTLGYHHDWDTKKYCERNKSAFPEDLKDLASYIAEAVGYPNYTAQAAIVNYYRMNSTLSGHTDHSEPNLDAPLVSISIGQAAIFLIGGESRNVSPTALLLRSGDIVVMAGKSRRCFHAVPKILSDRSVTDSMSADGDAGCGDILKYLRCSRININIRQVLPMGQSSLEQVRVSTR